MEFDSLMSGLERQVFGVYGDDTVVYPGHGDDTTLGEERPRLAEWRERGWCKPCQPDTASTPSSQRSTPQIGCP